MLMKVEDEFRDTFKDVGLGSLFTSNEIVSMVKSKHGEDNQYKIPTAYCYNRWSKGLDEQGRLCLFEYLYDSTDDKKYKYLGENYSYSGKVFHHPKGGEKTCIGECVDGVFYRDENAIGKMVENNDDWYPSLEEYNPNISVEQWREFWNDEEIFSEGLKILFKRLMLMGGTATYSQIAERFCGNKEAWHTFPVISKLGRNLSSRDICNLYNDDNSNGWAVPCFGRRKRKNIDCDVSGVFLFKLRDELVEALQQEGLQFGGADKIEKGSEVKIMPKHKKNLILYGPPGTGKTYNTVNHAVAIIENKTVEAVRAENRKEVLARFNQYKQDGLIEFCTFHQSFGYEEFIEGIKPKTDDSGNVVYDVVSGCFREFCEKQLTDKSIGLKENPTVWKIVLSKTSKNDIKTECLEKNHIRIGYGDEKTYEELINENDNGVIKDFVENMSVGDIVVVHCYPNSYEAIGIITSDFRKDDNYKEFKQVRDVRWILNDGNIRPVDAICTRFDTRATVARVGTANLNSILKIVEEFGDFPKDGNNDAERNRVFIIDEINRGNISKIFGELITLIEDCKRIGADEEMRARLPYSGKEFGVPNNVYLLGTMNTADRSIALIDTALRRRFKFVEMQPDVELLNGIEVEGVRIRELLEMINKRIEVLYDREHTIGHSFFMGLNNASTIADLAEVFECNVIPLLKEYFYNDFERIAAVLGDNGKSPLNFFDEQDNVAACLKNSNIEVDVPASYKFQKDALTKPEAYKKIYE